MMMIVMMVIMVMMMMMMMVVVVGQIAQICLKFLNFLDDNNMESYRGVYFSRTDKHDIPQHVRNGDLSGVSVCDIVWFIKSNDVIQLVIRQILKARQHKIIWQNYFPNRV